MPANAVVDEDGCWRVPVSQRPLIKNDQRLARLASLEQKAVEIPVARGDRKIPADELQKKLGKTTFRVWVTLLTLRNEELEAHPTLKGLAKRAYTTPRQVKQSLARLAKFKLIDNHGWMYRRVPCTCPKEVGWHEHEVFIRVIYGQLVNEWRTQVTYAVIPTHAFNMATKAAGQGGKRAGSGRPAGAKDKEPRWAAKGGIKRGHRKSNVSPYKYQDLVCLEEPYGSSHKRAQLDVVRTCWEGTIQEVLSVESTPDLVSESAPDFSGENTPDIQEVVVARKEALPAPFVPGSLEDYFNPEDFYREQSQPKAMAEAVPALSVDQPAPAAPSAAPAAQAVAPVVSIFGSIDGQPATLEDMLRSRGSKEVRLEGNASSARQQYTSEDMIAATKLANEIPTLHRPPAPRLTEATPPEDRLRILKAAYRAGHERVLKSEAFIRKSKKDPEAQEGRLLAAGEALIAARLNPTTWARFAFQMWTAATRKASAPTIDWVFNAALITEHAEWCHESMGEQFGATVIWVPGNKALIRALSEVRAALGWGLPTHDVVEEILPTKMRQEFIATANKQLERKQKELTKAIYNGEWVWD